MERNKPKTNKEYILAFGFRRLSACKKLGWKTISAFIKSENKIIDVPINDIYLVDNTRLTQTDMELEELMQSIKQDGLLQPIGLWKTTDLKEEDYIVINLLENIHRKDISPLELSKAVNHLKELGLNIGEIAVRLSIPKGRVENILYMIKGFPEEVIRNASFIGETKNSRTGKLPYAVVNSIARSWITQDKKLKLIKEAKKREFTVDDIELFEKLSRAGMPFRKALKEKDKYRYIDAKVIIDKKKFDSLGFGGRQYSDVINLMLTGKIPLQKDIFFYKKTLKEVKNKEVIKKVGE